MIVPMKKVTLVVLDRDRRAALTELRRVGVMHLSPRAATAPEIDAATERKNRAVSARAVLTAAAAEKRKAARAEASSDGASEELIDRIHELVAERSTLADGASRDRLELERLAPWGEVNPADFAALAAAGVDLALCEMDQKTYAALPDEVKVLVLSRLKGKVRCLLFREDGTVSSSLPVTANLVALPEISSAELRRRIASAEERIGAVAVELASLASRSPELEAAERRFAAEAEFERARAGMEFLTDEGEPYALVWLEGFVPESDMGAVSAAAKRHGWALMADDPGLDDAVPTKIHNPPLVRIIQPVFDFLGTVPNYREYDISSLFLLFFCVFFAMIFGDAGYGSVLLAAGLGLALKAKMEGKKVGDPVRLLLVLSSFTILWGVLTLSWFGIDADKLPAALKAVDLDWISNANPDSGENIKTLCFFLGTFQLSVAHLKNIKRDSGSLKFLAQIGLLLMVIGMLSMALNLVINSTRFPIPTYALYFIAVGFGLNFLFANWESGWGFFRGLAKSVTASLINIVSVFLGIVNVFADIVSYIRLWAVGLAGVAISQTINNMAGPLLGKLILFLVAVFALTVGHGFNMMLSVLSVIVHGVRLNMLEFSGHLGMEWSGFSYDPFRERAENKETSSKE